MATPHTFLIVIDQPSSSPNWENAQSMLEDLSLSCRQILGFQPDLRLAYLPVDLPLMLHQIPNSLDEVIEEEINNGKNVFFIFPAILEFSILQKEDFSQIISTARKQFSGIEFYYDDVDLSHPLLVQAFVGQAQKCLSPIQLSPDQLGLLLVASGHGNATDRAESYRLMRLIWEQLGLAAGEVAFIRHDKPFLADQLQKSLSLEKSNRSLLWVAISQAWWPAQHQDYAKAIYRDAFSKKEDRSTCIFVDSLGPNPLVLSWLQKRILHLWKGFRQQQHRQRSAKYKQLPRKNSFLYGPDGHTTPLKVDNSLKIQNYMLGNGLVAEVNDQPAFALLTDFIGIKSKKVFIKVTWHGYATGTYTDPVALDKFLSILSGKAILLESYTSSRNDGTKEFDWTTECKQHRDWIRQQDSAFLAKTGLSEVIKKHKAHYVNLTELFWDGQCTPQPIIDDLLSSQNIKLTHPELSQFIPRVLYDNRGADFISFARFKGPTRLSIANMFGLIPIPFRSKWHGSNITDFAVVCCDLVKIYGCLFNLHTIIESLNYAVRWDRNGLYRSRWGNYDLIDSLNIVCMSQSLAIGDVLASQIQGQSIEKSAFFDVVRSNFNIPPQVLRASIPDDLKAKFA